MSRSGYSDSGNNLWRGAVQSAVAGKRGQSFLREMAAALDSMPIKELIASAIVADGAVCAMGSVALARKIDISDLDIDEPDDVAARFGIARALACEIAYENDECGDSYRDGKYASETPVERWTRMRKWVTEQLLPATAAVLP